MIAMWPHSGTGEAHPAEPGTHRTRAASSLSRTPLAFAPVRSSLPGLGARKPCAVARVPPAGLAVTNAIPSESLDKGYRAM